MQNLQKTWTSDFENIIHARPQGHVLALCLHPALDVTVHVQNGQEISRQSHLGGKAINLARMLHALGAKVTLVAPADKQGKTKALLQDCEFDFELIDTDLCLRENVKLIDADGSTQEHNGMAGTVSPQQYTQLIHKVLHICRTRQISILALCGSFPQGVEKGVYKYLTEQAKALNIACVTDASGESLSLAIQAKPSLIKPNLKEFSDYIAQDFSMWKTLEQIEKAIFEAYCQTGVPILCSLDKHGSIYAGEQGTFIVNSRRIERVSSFAGAGDTMLASFVFARMLCGANIQQSLCFASAAATAKVALPADQLPDADQIFTEWMQTNIKKGGA